MSEIVFDRNGLVPAIAVDAYTNEVLMQAFMDRQALDLTLETGQAHYFSRSRNALWRKGETSGHTQEVVEVLTDCDCDSILLRVIQTGPACHTGNRSCFFRLIKTLKRVGNLAVLYKDVETIRSRAEKPEDGSYTNYLLEKGVEKICKKVGEEASETIIAAMKNDREELACELADLYYHTLVLMHDRGLELEEVMRVLEDRHTSARKRNYHT